MQPRRGLPYGVALAVLAVLAILGWMRTTPAAAQQEIPPVPGQTLSGQTPPPISSGPPRSGFPLMIGPSSIAAAGNFVYILRGNTLYQLRASDLSVSNMKSFETPPPAYNGGR